MTGSGDLDRLSNLVSLFGEKKKGELWLMSLGGTIGVTAKVGVS